MKQVSLTQATKLLAKLYAEASPNEEIALTRNGVPFAKVVKPGPKASGTRTLGFWADNPGWIADDFDAPMALVTDKKTSPKKRT